MEFELRVPAAGESVTEVEIGEWRKRPGDPVSQDEVIVVLETDKAALEVPSPVSGTLLQVLKEVGDVARPGEAIALLTGPGEGPAPPAVEEPTRPAAQPAEPAGTAAAPEAPEAAPRGAVAEPAEELREPARPEKREAAPARAPAQPEAGAAPPPSPGRQEDVVPMSALRRHIAERLVQAQRNAALLTTFNEIDMAAVIALRRELQPAFQERYGVKLGFMSFFVKACIEALKQVPQLNAEVRGDSIVYRNYYDIGIAIGSGRGLVVPVLRNAERMSFAEVERAIDDFARRAQEGSLQPDELHGGTFTITNGGVYGSLLSTPIVNPPQSGVLGMHAIQDRPVARQGQVVVRPMMYVALTYDHRVADGREAVTFLRRVKECIEEPARLLLEV